MKKINKNSLFRHQNWKYDLIWGYLKKLEKMWKMAEKTGKEKKVHLELSFRELKIDWMLINWPFDDENMKGDHHMEIFQGLQRLAGLVCAQVLPEQALTLHHALLIAQMRTSKHPQLCFHGSIRWAAVAAIKIRFEMNIYTFHIFIFIQVQIVNSLLEYS